MAANEVETKRFVSFFFSVVATTLCVMRAAFPYATKYVFIEDTISLAVSLSAMMLENFPFNTPTTITRIVPNATSISPFPAPFWHQYCQTTHFTTPRETTSALLKVFLIFL